VKTGVLGHGLVEELKKLPQGDLVHAVDQTHLTDKEVENAASRCNCAHTPQAHCHTPFTRYNQLSNGLYNRFDNRLDVCLHDTAGCQPGLATVLNEQPLFIQPVVKRGCTTGLTTGLTTGCIHDTDGCQTGCQTGLTTG